MVGLSASITVMLKLHDGPPLTEHVTIVVPLWKVEPDAGEQVTAPQVEAGVVYVATALHCPGLALVIMFVGQLSVQAVTVTVNEQLPELPAASCTEQLTVVVPTGKFDPEAGEQTGMPTPEQLSETVGAE
jgi:hypothetical protein